MITSTIHLLHALPLLALFSTVTEAQQTSVTAVIQLAPAPASLEASVVTRYTTLPSGGGTEGVVTYSVDCPITISPENDACRSLSIYPAEVYHTDGSVWGGVFTARAENRTTTWECSLGDCSTCEATRATTCHHTIVSGDTSTTSLQLRNDGCAIERLRVPLVITAGVEKLQSYSWKGMLTDVAGYHSAWDAALASAGCPACQSLVLQSAASTTTSAPTTSSSAQGSRSTSTGAPNTASASTRPTTTGTSSSPTSSTGAGSRSSVASGGFLAVACLFAWLL